MKTWRLLYTITGVVITIVFLFGCGAQRDEPSPLSVASTQISQTPTASPTAGLLPYIGDQLPPSAGEMEIRIPLDIYAEGEIPSSEISECVNTIPFQISKDESRTMVDGEGLIYCHFESTPEGSPITFHVILEFTGALNGELLPASPEKPTGWLDAYLKLDGVITQYYIGYPPEAINPCPESEPCQQPISDLISLPFDYEEGSTVTTSWTFILHLR